MCKKDLLINAVAVLMNVADPIRKRAAELIVRALVPGKIANGLIADAAEYAAEHAKTS